MTPEADPRRILFLVPTLRAGGAERVVVTLLRHLDRRRFAPTLAVVNLTDAVYRDDIPDDVTLIDLGSKRVRDAVPRIVRLLWRMRPNVVFSTLGHLNLALAMLRPVLPTGTRYCARETTIVSRVNEGYRRPGLWNWAYRRFYARLDMVVCQSIEMRDDLVSRHGFPSAKAVVIHNPVDAARIRQLSTGAASGLSARERGETPGLQLLAVGRLSSEKGLDLLLRALALCGEPAPLLTVVGEGPLRGDLEQLARRLGIARNVTFAGFQANPYPFFHDADALVLSSRYEGFPNVALEALACGTPVIATPLPSVAEIVGNVPGCLIAAEISAEALARELRRFVAGTRVPSDAVHRFDAGAIARRYEDALS